MGKSRLRNRKVPGTEIDEAVPFFVKNALECERSSVQFIAMYQENASNITC